MSTRNPSNEKKSELGEWLSTFKIELTSNSPSLYGNGRQQVEVTLIVEGARDIVITQEQLNTLTIVHRNDLGEYAPLPDTQSEDLDWFASLTRDERFDYYEGSVHGHFAAPDTDAVLSKRFYVSTVASGGSVIELHAQIEMAPDAIFVTEDTNDSSIKLSAVTLPSYIFPDHYTWANTWQQGDSNGSAFIQEWSLAANQPAFSCAEERAGNPNGMIKWQRNAPEESAASNVGTGYPGDTEFRYNPSILVGDDFAARRHKNVESDNKSHVVVVLQADNRIPYNAGGLAHQGPCRVLVYDKNGNTHELEFSFGTEGTTFEQRTTLRVNVNSPARGSLRSVETNVGAPKDA